MNATFFAGCILLFDFYFELRIGKKMALCQMRIILGKSKSILILFLFSMTYHFCGYTSHNSPGFYVFCNYGSRSDHCTISYSNARKDDAPTTYPAILTYLYRCSLASEIDIVIIMIQRPNNSFICNNGVLAYSQPHSSIEQHPGPYRYTFSNIYPFWISYMKAVIESDISSELYPHQF